MGRCCQRAVAPAEPRRHNNERILDKLVEVLERPDVLVAVDRLQRGGCEGEEIIGTMIFVPSIWTLEIDGKPTLAFEAMKYREADEICHQEWLRLELGQRKINHIPLCGADSKRTSIQSPRE
jgi:hypothetical protein